MTKPLICIFKKLEDPDDLFEVPERYAPRLQDEGLIEFSRWGELITFGFVSISGFRLTEAGKKEFEKWKYDPIQNA